MLASTAEPPYRLPRANKRLTAQPVHAKLEARQRRELSQLRRDRACSDCVNTNFAGIRTRIVRLLEHTTHPLCAGCTPKLEHDFSPVSWLFPRLRTVSAARFPSSGGMDPGAKVQAGNKRNLAGGGIKNIRLLQKQELTHALAGPTSIFSVWLLCGGGNTQGTRSPEQITKTLAQKQPAVWSKCKISFLLFRLLQMCAWTSPCARDSS